jgi:ribonuclease P protein component
MSLPKKNRFSFKNKLPKNTLNSQSFSVRYQRNDEGLKIAVVVSKRVDKRATTRNKLKREVLKILKDKIGTDINQSLIFYLKSSITGSTNLERELEEAINKINHV